MDKEGTLAQVEANEPTLRELWWCGTSADDSDVAALASLLQEGGNTVLRSIDLLQVSSPCLDSSPMDGHARACLSDASAAALIPALEECNVLRVSLGFTSVSPQKVRELTTLGVSNAARLLAANDPTLTALSWRNLGGEPGLYDSDVAKLSKALSGNTHCRFLDFCEPACPPSLHFMRRESHLTLSVDCLCRGQQAADKRLSHAPERSPGRQRTPAPLRRIWKAQQPQSCVLVGNAGG